MPELPTVTFTREEMESLLDRLTSASSPGFRDRVKDDILRGAFPPPPMRKVRRITLDLYDDENLSAWPLAKDFIFGPVLGDVESITIQVHYDDRLIPGDEYKTRLISVVDMELEAE